MKRISSGLAAVTIPTWVMVAVFALRLGVQVPLYLADAATSLGVARLVMGLPLYALGLWLAWSVSAPSSPYRSLMSPSRAAVDMNGSDKARARRVATSALR